MYCIERRVPSHQRRTGAAPALSGVLLRHGGGAGVLRPATTGADTPGSGRRARFCPRTGRSCCGYWPRRILNQHRRRRSKLSRGAGVVVTGQQVGLFGGPLFTPSRQPPRWPRARGDGSGPSSPAAVFWLASEDHDFAEINHAVFPARRELRRLEYAAAPEAPQPVGGLVLDDSIKPLVDQAYELLGASDAMGALAAAYQPGRTFAQAFAEFYSRAFAAQGLLVLDAGSRAFHRIGSPVLRAAVERADELHAALVERNRSLEATGYHAQVAVGEAIRACCS